MKRMFFVVLAIMAMVASAMPVWATCEGGGCDETQAGDAAANAFIQYAREHGDQAVGGQQWTDSMAKFKTWSPNSAEDVRIDANLDGQATKPDPYNPLTNSSWSLMYVTGTSAGESAGPLKEKVWLKGGQDNWSLSETPDKLTYAVTYGRTDGEVKAWGRSDGAPETTSANLTAQGFGVTSAHEVNDPLYKERIANLESEQTVWGSYSGDGGKMCFSGENHGAIQTFILDEAGITGAQGMFNQTSSGPTPMKLYGNWDATSYVEKTPSGGIKAGSSMSGVNHIGPYTPPPPAPAQ